MNILSLFDGISVGQLALKRAGIEVDKYYASEIDKYAIKVTKYNFSNTIHIGSVTDVDVNKLEPIDLLIGGSPCTDLSFAGKQKGLISNTLNNYLKLKKEGFEFKGQSYLFWEYIRILKDLQKINPNIKFLLENVRMKKEWEDLITRELGVYPIVINSKLVSAQSRVRYYWTNIKCVTQPEDKGILFKDISIDGTSKCGGIRGRYIINGKIVNYRPENGMTQKLEIRDDGKTNCITTVPKDNVAILNDNNDYRYLTPLEYERLQTVPDNYTKVDGVSNTQRKKMLGNGWTVDIIAHIFSFINKPYKQTINDFLGF